jgi:hypothetical protein
MTTAATAAAISVTTIAMTVSQNLDLRSVSGSLNMLGRDSEERPRHTDVTALAN